MNDTFEIFDKLKTESIRIEPIYIILDETDNNIKEIALSSLDSAGTLNRDKKVNAAILIHQSIIG
jgi:hypothetical protein